MRRTSIAELKAKLSEYVARARRGEEVIITDRGEPVARLTGLGAGQAQDGRIAGLVRAGVVRPPRSKLPRDFLTRDLPPDPDDAVMKAVLEERSEGW